jgi:hypothetical protein
MVWHDGHGSYNFLEASPKFQSDYMIYSKGQLSKRNNEGRIVSTNAVEGPFGRMKKKIRKNGFKSAARRR